MLNTKRYALAAIVSLLVLVSGASLASPSTPKSGNEMAKDTVAQIGTLSETSRGVASDDNMLANLADALCLTIYNSSMNLQKEFFLVVTDYISRFTPNKNPSKADAVKFLNANKHELITQINGRHFMTCAIESRVATPLLMRTFSIDIKDLKDENGEKVSIDFNGIYVEDGVPKTVMNYFQEAIKSNRYTFETKVQFKRVVSYIYHANGARRFHKLTLTPEEKQRFPQKAVVPK